MCCKCFPHWLKWVPLCLLKRRCTYVWFVHSCVSVCLPTHILFESPVLHTRFFKIFLKKYQHFLWLSYISLGLTGIFVCVTSKHRLSVRRKEKRFVVGFVWLKKLTQLIQFSLGSLTGNFSFCIFKPISAFSWPKRLFLSFCFFS